MVGWCSVKHKNQCLSDLWTPCRGYCFKGILADNDNFEVMLVTVHCGKSDGDNSYDNNNDDSDSDVVQ